MRILILNDLHMDANSDYLGLDIKVLEQGLVDWIRGKEVGKVLVVGDIGNSMIKSLSFLAFMERELGVEVEFVPGNHEFWSDNFSSMMSYYSMSKYNLFDYTKHLTGDIELVGCFGWYDYSYKPEHYSVDEIIELKENHWNDGKYIIYGDITDLEIAEKYYLKLERRLEEVKDKRVWLMTHFIPYKGLLENSDGDEILAIRNSFMGSERVGDLIDSYDNIEKVFLGHAHFSINEENFRGKDVYCNPVAYKHDWRIEGLEGLELYLARVEEMHKIIKI